MKFNYICPVCGSEELYKGNLESFKSDSDTYLQHYTCLICDADIYLSFELTNIIVKGERDEKVF